MPEPPLPDHNTTTAFTEETPVKPAYKTKYPHLFSPMPVGRKGQLVYKNRILVPPMGPTGDGVDSHNRINPDGVKFYTQFACGGFAGITASTPKPKRAPWLGKCL